MPGRHCRPNYRATQDFLARRHYTRNHSIDPTLTPSPHAPPHPPKQPFHQTGADRGTVPDPNQRPTEHIARLPRRPVLWRNRATDIQQQAFRVRCRCRSGGFCRCGTARRKGEGDDGSRIGPIFFREICGCRASCSCSCATHGASGTENEGAEVSAGTTAVFCFVENIFYRGQRICFSWKDDLCSSVTDAESARTPDGFGKVSPRSDSTIASFNAKSITSPIGSPATSLLDKSSTSPTGSPATKDAFSSAVQSVVRPLIKNLLRRAEARDQVDSSRVTMFQAASRPAIVDSPIFCVPPDTPDVVLTRSGTPSVFAETPKRIRSVNSKTPEQECPDTLSQLRTLAAYKRTKWAETLVVKDSRNPVPLPLKQDFAYREQSPASTSFAESNESPRVDDSEELAERGSFGHGKASLPEVSPFTQTRGDLHLGGPRDRVFIPGPVATPHWYHNPYASESPTKLTSAHSAQSLVYAPSLEVMHEGLVTDVSLKSLPSGSSADWRHDDLGFTDSELRDLGWKLAGDSPVKQTSLGTRSPIVSPFLEHSTLPIATSSPSWHSEDMGCTESELERLGWRFGNPVSGARVTLGSTPVPRIDQQIASPKPFPKAAFNPPPVQTPY